MLVLVARYGLASLLGCVALPCDDLQDICGANVDKNHGWKLELCLV